jgi:hypothetical protein
MRFTVIFSTLLLAVVSAPAYAGQIGSGSTNSFGTERFTGTSYSNGTNQTVETLNGVSRSSSAKSEFLAPEGIAGRVGASFGSYADSNGTAFGYCNAAVNADPACLTSASRTDSAFSKSSATNTHFGNSGRIEGETKTIGANSYSSF